MADESVSDLLNGKTMEQASQELSDSLAGDLGAEPTSEEVGASPPASGTQEVKPAAQPEILPEAKAPPKSWKAEWHEHWPKLDPKVQEILEQREADMAAGVEPLKADAALARTFKDVLTPYQPLLDSQGLKDPAYVVRSLLNTHYQLSTFDDAKKAQLFVDLAKLYKVDLQKAVAGLDEVPFINPSLQEVLGRLDKVEGSITAERTAAVNELRSKTMEEVKAFASDPAHTYFNDVADHVVLLLQDPRISLKDAYEQALAMHESQQRGGVSA